MNIFSPLIPVAAVAIRLLLEKYNLRAAALNIPAQGVQNHLVGGAGP